VFTRGIPPSASVAQGAGHDAFAEKWGWFHTGGAHAGFQFGVALRLLMGDAASTAAMAETLQVRRWQRRTLALIQSDLARAAGWQINPEPALLWPCAGSGRQPRLAIMPLDGSPPVVYFTGEAPSPIWREPVLMRCGPAFTLEGFASQGAYQNRVVLDGVDLFELKDHASLPVLLLELRQHRGSQQIRSVGVG